MNTRGITRRDFLNGVALGVAGSLAPLDVLGGGAGNYPPLLTGMRGSHPGSFEVAHALAWAGQRFERPAELTDDVYDLVVVGGGISGLAAAHYWREARGADARILVLDNHDDIGGHAKRNEFVVDGRTLIGYGGSQSIDTPGEYSEAAKQLLVDVGIDVKAFYDYFDVEFAKRFGLGRGIHLRRETYGRDASVADFSGSWGTPPPDDLEAVLAATPLTAAEQVAIRELLTSGRDYLGDRTRAERIAHLKRTSYTEFLRRDARMPERVAALYRDTVKGYWGLGYDAVSALEAYRLGAPGMDGLALDNVAPDGPFRDEPYIFHFPDGNAAVARALLRRLRPDVLAGEGMAGLVAARLDYDALDRRGSACRVRLQSTAVDVRHAANGQAVDVTYVQAGREHRVRGRHAVLACYNNMLPHLCPELPAAQREALEWPEKVPLVYMSIAVRNWRAFAESGFYDFYVPESPLMHSFGLDFPVSIGEYRFTDDPSQPTVIHGSYVPTVPGRGLSGREQHVAGRRRLYETSFAEFESDIVAQMEGALGSAFDAERDIAAITVNRWPHGYAYEYNELFDPPGWGPREGPHVAGRAQLGRISIANSDSQAYAYVDGAIDAAYRAVQEQARPPG